MVTTVDSDEGRKVTLLDFFVYNPTYGPMEGEEENKILFYYPPDTDIDTQIRNVGLCEAVVKFTSTFNREEPCECLHTKQTKQFLYSPEEDFWMVLIVSIPSVIRVRDRTSQVEDFFPDLASDKLLRSLLIQAYQMFRFFMGTYSSIVSESLDPKSSLRSAMNHFYSKYVQTIDLEQADITDMLQGLQFLPLDKYSFLRISSLVNAVEEAFPMVSNSVFLLDDLLIWSGIEQRDMQVFYRYLTTSLFPSAEFSSSTESPSAATYTVASRGRFLTGPSNLQCDDLGKIPHVYLYGETEGDSEGRHLVVYTANRAVLCLFIQYSTSLDMSFFRSLDSFLSTHMVPFSMELLEQVRNRPSSLNDPCFRFIYFNHLNSALKSSLRLERKRLGPFPSLGVVRMLPDIHKDLHSLDCCGELSVKLSNDQWIVAKVSDHRETYVVLSQKNSSLLDVTDEVQKLYLTQFSHIFFNS